MKGGMAKIKMAISKVHEVNINKLFAKRHAPRIPHVESPFKFKEQKLPIPHMPGKNPGIGKGGII